MTKKQFSFVDLFAGCGGLSLGLEQAGFKPVFVNELNSDALSTYLFNRRDQFPYLSDSRFHTKNIKEIVSLDPEVLERLKLNLLQYHNLDVFKADSDLDLLVGGPPCQGYSGIGHRRSYSVEKAQLPSNHLYQDMAFMITQLKPKIFLFENVKGLLNSKWTKNGEKGEIWKDVKQTFENLPNYSIRWKLVLAKDYGIPQNRPRILLAGIRNDLGFELKDSDSNYIAGGLIPNPKDYSVKPPNLEDVLSDLVDPNYENGGRTSLYPSQPMNKIQSMFRINKKGIPTSLGDPLTEQEYSNHSEKVVKKFQHMIKNGGEIPEEYKTKKFSQKVLQARWKDKGPNITITSLPDDYVHWAQPRTLTVREYARIQTFPDWYEFMGKRTTGGIRRAGNPRESLHYREVPKYTQIGNAVPVLLAKIIGQHFSDLLKLY